MYVVRNYCDCVCYTCTYGLFCMCTILAEVRKVLSSALSVVMSYDSRGVLRGPCTGCPCMCYNGGQDLKKCLDCGHPPGKHQNLDDPTAFAAPNSQVGSQPVYHNSTGTPNPW